MLLNKILGFIHSKKEGKNCMKTTGITRRIDELGRVVIPKEIRKNMHIKSGELLEIFLDGSDSILLKKHNTINKANEFIDFFIKRLSLKINANIFISNTEKIIFSNLSEEKQKNISLALENYDGKNFNDSLYINKEYKLKQPYEIFSISPNGDFVGYMIFEYLSPLNEITKEISRFSFDFIQNFFEND